MPEAIILLTKKSDMKDYLLLFRGEDARRIDEQKSPEKWQAHML